MITKAIDELLDGTNWGELDAMIIDLPPGTGDAQLGIAQDLELTGSIGVTTPQEVSLVDMRRGITTFERLEVPLWGLVENMSGFVCPHCGEHSDIFGKGGGLQEAENRGVPCLGQIPLDPAIREAEDRQTPVMVHAPDSPAAQEYAQIAQAVAERIGQSVGQS
jgi:ATP-binding protein involved in chromosome partitioning